jgi:hypothetical protein
MTETLIIGTRRQQMNTVNAAANSVIMLPFGVLSEKIFLAVCMSFPR